MNKYFRLILISFITLFLELLLIRLIGTEIRIFAYLSNVVLLAIFIGSGLGMLIKKKISLLITSLLLLILSFIIITGIFSNITDLLSPINESFIWFQSSWKSLGGIITGLILTTLLFLMTMVIFIPLGQCLGEIFNNSKRIILFYSLNVVASLIGMWTFHVLSYFNFSPFIGIVFVQTLILSLVSAKERFRSVSILILTIFIILFNHLNTEKQNIWSPYQKLTLVALAKNEFMPDGYLLQVNNVGYMGLLNLSDDYNKSIIKKITNQKLPDDFDIRFENQYDLPYIIKPESIDVLIVGAGGGNDVAGAIRAKIQSIDAVEIDPKIIDIGRQYHPEKPYSKSNVRIIIDDGRSFFKTTKKKYDIVIMGLADSHTLTSSLTNLQLDNYLYTKESMEEIKNILKDDGLLFITFDVRRPWIGARIQNTMNLVFGHKPYIFSMQNEPTIFGWGGVVFINRLLSDDKNLAKFIQARKVEYDSKINILSDDWPYLYLDKPRIPIIHLSIFLMLILIYIFINKSVTLKGVFRFDSFFLGAGFLLYEFQNITKTSLLFGNTWITNLFTISAILLFILSANLISWKITIPLRFCYTGLIASFLLQLFISLPALNLLSVVSKVIIGSFLLNLPLLFSGLIFIYLFSKSTQKSAFFASNLLGSSLGGMLGVLSYALGIKILLFVSFLLYILSLLNIWLKKSSISFTL